MIEKLKKEYKASNKRGTAYCVYQVKEIINPKQNYIDNCEECDEEPDDEYLEYLEEEKEIPNRVTETIFLTEQSAQRFIDRKGHDLSKPFIYGVSLYWNDDLRELLQEIGFDIND